MPYPGQLSDYCVNGQPVWIGKLQQAPSTAAHLWDLQRRARIATLHKNLYARSFGWVGFGPGGRVLVTPLDHGVQLWDIRRRSRPATIGARDGPGVGLSPDGRILATGDGRLWDLRRRIPLRNRFSPPQGIATVAFAPGGRILAISAYDRTVRLWDVRRDQQLGILERNLDELVPAMAFSPMGSYSPQAAAMDRFGYGTYSDAARRQP